MVVNNMFPIRVPVSIGGKGLFEALNKNKDFNYFFSRNTEAAEQLKNQINEMKLRVEVYPSTQGRSGHVKLFILKNKSKYRKGEKVFSLDEGIPIWILTPLAEKGEGSGTNRAMVVVDKKTLLEVTSGDIQSDLPWLQLRAPIIETEPAPVEDGGQVAKKLDFKFQVTDPFEFDSPEITQNAEDAIGREMDRLKLELKEDGVYEQYLQEKINGKDIIVNAYSSIDAKSDEIGGGKVSECSPGGTTTRAQYNLCLSQKRAETIVNHLISNYKDIFGKAKLVAKGMGELESPNSVNEPYYIKATAEHIKKYPKLNLRLGQRFRNPPQKKHSDTNRVATAADRKFVINLPSFQVEKIVKK